MTRRDLRIHVFKIIYSYEFYNSSEFENQCDIYLKDQNLDDDNSKLIKNKACAVFNHIEEIDIMINECAVGWKTSRMSRVDLAILRVAIYEMLYDEDIPISVAINEAVELSKSYSSDDSPGFINGILGNIAKKGKA